jgi:hypothetical protein
MTMAYLKPKTARPFQHRQDGCDLISLLGGRSDRLEKVPGDLSQQSNRRRFILRCRNMATWPFGLCFDEVATELADSPAFHAVSNMGLT